MIIKNLPFSRSIFLHFHSHLDFWISFRSLHNNRMLFVFILFLSLSLLLHCISMRKMPSKMTSHIIYRNIECFANQPTCRDGESLYVHFPLNVQRHMQPHRNFSACPINTVQMQRIACIQLNTVIQTFIVCVRPLIVSLRRKASKFSLITFWW